MIALATPFGSYIENGVRSTTAGLFETSEKAMNVVGMSAGDGNFEEGYQGGGSGESGEPETVVAGATFIMELIENCTCLEYGMYHECWQPIEPTTLTWEELKGGKYADKFGYTTSKIGDTTLGHWLFDGDCSVYSVVLPDGMLELRENAFYRCYLNEITIPNTVKSIGIYAFGLTSLRSITFDGTTNQWNNIEKGESWNLYCPEIMVTCTDGTIIVPANNG